MRVGYRTCKKGSAKARIESLAYSVYGLIVVPRSIEMMIFSSPWYLSIGEASIVEIEV